MANLQISMAISIIITMAISKKQYQLKKVISISKNNCNKDN